MKYPKAINKEKVGTYSALAFSGGGYFYDEVLEYRVWVRPPNGDEVHYYYFENFEEALEYSKNTEGAKYPLALVLQNAYIESLEEGIFSIVNKERIAEWRVEWLLDGKREEGTLEKFIEEHQKK